MLKWVAKRLKHIWSNTDRTIDTSRWASAVRMPRLKHVWYAAVQTNKRSPIKHENKRNVSICCLNVWWPSNFLKHDQTHTNMIKQHQTRCPNGKMFGHQTMFDGVWSPTFIVCPGPNIQINARSNWSISHGLFCQWTHGKFARPSKYYIKAIGHKFQWFIGWKTT